MGYILTATCEYCGLKEQLFVAWGFSAIVPGKKGPTYDMEVAACFNCGVLTVADRVSKKDKCPKCRHPIKEGQLICSDCGQNLQIKCPHCGQTTFFTDYCNKCGQRLTVICAKCGEEQPPISKKCLKCDKPLY